MINYQNQNFASSDIKESVFLKSSLWKRRCYIKCHIKDVYKISNGQERKQEGESELQKFENLEDKRIFFGRTKSFFDNFLKVFFLIAKIRLVVTSFNCHNKISYIKNLMHA